MLELIKYNDEKKALCELIKKFWIAHNDYTPTDAEALEDCEAWTGEGHVVYFIAKERETIGFVHWAPGDAKSTGLRTSLFCPSIRAKATAPRLSTSQKK